MKTNHILSAILALFFFSVAAQKDSIRDVTNIFYQSMRHHGVLDIHPLDGGEYLAQTSWWNGENAMQRLSGLALEHFNDSSRLAPSMNLNFPQTDYGSPNLLDFPYHYREGCYVQVDNFGAALYIYRPVDERIDTAYLPQHRILSRPVFVDNHFYFLATPTRNKFYVYQDSIHLYKVDEQNLDLTLLQSYTFSRHLDDWGVKELKLDFEKDSLYLYRYEQDSVFGSHGYELNQAYGFSLSQSTVADTFKEYSKKYNELNYYFQPYKIGSRLINNKDLRVYFKLFKNDSTVYRTLQSTLSDDLSKVSYPLVRVSEDGDTTIYLTGSDSIGTGPYPHRTVLLAFDGKLNFKWRRNYLQKMNSWGRTIVEDSDGNLLIGGSYSLGKTYYRRYRAFVMRVSPSGEMKKNSLSASVNIYPNPVKNELHFYFAGKIISYQIFTLNGVELARGEANSKNNEHQINISALEAGHYILHFKDSKGEAHSIRFMKAMP